MAVYEGEGTSLHVGATSTVTEIGQVFSISGPGMAVGEIEKTHLASTFKEFRPGLLDIGQVTFSIYFDSANTQHTLVESSITTPATLYWELQTTDGKTRAFQGFPVSFNYTGMEVEGNLTAEVTIRVTTVPVISTTGA